MNQEEQYSNSNYTITAQDKIEIESLLDKVEKAGEDLDHILIIGLEEICSYLTEEEAAQLTRVYSIDPTLYGFKKPKAGLEPVATDIVKIEPQPYLYKGEKCLTQKQYVPARAYKAYELMAKAMQKKLGRRLLIESCYRSSAYQAITFLSVLRLNDYDIPATIERAAVPAYSEHATPSKLAFDFMNEEGLPSFENPEDFEKTQEYEWLMANAYKYDFYLTYPRDNTYGAMFEPWHWRYVPPK